MSDNVEDCFECEDPRMPMFCISNKRKFYGAIGAIIKGEILEEHFPNGYYILPSSVHEVLLIPNDDCSMDADALTDMVRAVNANEVRPEEVLSDHAYFMG